MPTYTYECSSCGRFEKAQKITDDPLSECPSCGAKGVRRLLSAPAFHLKGSGWYKTDYGGNGSKGSSKESKESDSGSSASSSEKTESKPSGGGSSKSSDSSTD